MEMFAWKPGGIVKGLDLNFYQYVLNESGDSVDSYMLGGQIVPTFDLGSTNDLAVGATFEAISKPERVAALYFKEALVIDSGYVTNFVNPNIHSDIQTTMIHAHLAADYLSDAVGKLPFAWQGQPR